MKKYGCLLLLSFAMLVVGCGKTSPEEVKKIEPMEEMMQEETIAEEIAVEQIEPSEQQEIIEGEKNPYHRVDANLVKDASVYPGRFTKEQYERFADRIVTDFVDRDWEDFAGIMCYPAIINNVFYENKEEFLNTDWTKVFSENFIDEVASLTTDEVYYNEYGVHFGRFFFGQATDLKNFDYYIGIYEIDYTTADAPKGDDQRDGAYIIDFDVTNEKLVNHSTIEEVFSDTLDSGNYMFISEEGGTVYYVLGIVSTGTAMCFTEENEIWFNYTSWDVDTSRSGSYEIIDGVSYVIMPYNDVDIYWKKLARP